ncbi:MAG TPA: hypothetical protein VFL16_02525 [Steroidobacteraceae bacterium]|nr:hypothetical protein [Steroidobacteraceae bacterium]
MEISRHAGGGAARVLGWAAAACWLASWLLPVVRGYPGYAAFHAALTGPFGVANPVRGEQAAAELLSALTNAAFLVMFVAWLRGRVSRPALMLKVALACLLMNLYWLVEAARAGELGELMVGYYAWLAAFLLLVALAAVIASSAHRTSRTPTGDTPA